MIICTLQLQEFRVERVNNVILDRSQSGDDEWLGQDGAAAAPTEVKGGKTNGKAACEDMVFEIYTFTVSRKVKPYNVRVCIGSEPITMELDTGASLSTIGEKVYRDKLSRYKLRKSEVKLRSYTGDRVPVLGSIKVPVRYNGGES